MLGPKLLDCSCCGCPRLELLLLMSEAVSADQHARRELNQYLIGHAETDYASFHYGG